MFFGSKKDDYFLGVDFGTRSIKAVELKLKKDTPELVNYGWVVLDRAKEALDSFEGDYAKLLHEALVSLLRSLQPHTQTANVAIPAYNGLVMMVDFPEMSEEDLAKAIQFESRKYIPTSLEDVNVSWEIIGKSEEAGKMQVLLVAAPKSEVQYYDHLFAQTGVTVDTLELETFALARTAIGKKKGRYLLADIGAKTTNLVLIEDGAVRVNRNVDVGGIDLTNAIADHMKIAPERAREMKESGKNFFEGPMPLTFPSLGYIVNEIQRILRAQKSDALDGLILSGGSAQLAGLTKYFEEQVGVTVTQIDPLANIAVEAKNAATLRARVDASYSVAIGLALQGIYDAQKE